MGDIFYGAIPVDILLATALVLSGNKKGWLNIF
jgi:hypothetical protein